MRAKTKKAKIDRIVKLYEKFPKVLKKCKIEKIKKWKNNPNNDFSQVKRLAKIFNRFGQISPLVVWSKNNVCYKGNHSLEALKYLGCKTVEVIVVDFPDLETAELYGLADNQASKMTALDDEAIVSLLQSDRVSNFADPEEIRMITGFTDKEYKGLLMQTEDMPETLPNVSISGIIPSKTDFIVVQFEDKKTMEAFKALAGIENLNKRVIPFKAIKKYVSLKSKKIRRKRNG